MTEKRIVTRRPAETLLYRLVDVFAVQEEIKAIYSFGSVSTGKSDAFSDVDISIISYDAAQTCQLLMQTLAKISVPEGIYVIFEKDNSAAYTVLLADQSPYQKIDIGITSSADRQELFEHSTLHYSSSNKSEAISNSIPTLSQSLGDNQLMDCLLGSIRYLKHIRRNEVWTAYKFYRGFMEQYLRMILDVNPQKKLALEDFKQMDERDEDVRDMIFNASTEEMNHKFLKYLEKYVERSYEGAIISEQYYQYARKIIGFWHGEIEQIN